MLNNQNKGFLLEVKFFAFVIYVYVKLLIYVCTQQMFANLLLVFALNVVFDSLPCLFANLESALWESCISNCSL